MTENLLISQIPFDLLTDTVAEKVLAKISPILTDAVRVSQTGEEYYTAAEAMRFLKCSRVTLIDWEKRGLIKGSRIGTRVRYNVGDLKTALSKQN